MCRVFVGWSADYEDPALPTSSLVAGFGTEAICLDGDDDDCALWLDDNTDGGGVSMFAGIDKEGKSFRPAPLSRAAKPLQ